MVSFKSLGKFSVSNSLCLVEDTWPDVTLIPLSPTSFSNFFWFWWGVDVYGVEGVETLEKNYEPTFQYP